MRANSQFALFFLLFLTPLARPQNVFPSKSLKGSQPLEIRLVRPPLWHDHYLEITIACVNRSKSRIFLPSTPGVKMYSSVTQAKSILELEGQEAWILVYGWSDVIESGGKTLAPGSEEQNTYYIGETFLVKDMVTNETRQVRLQGRLRILAAYEQNVPKRKIDGQQEDVSRSSPATEADSGGRNRQAALEIQIPCPVGVANSDCFSPPPLFPGEHDQWSILPKAPVL